MHLAAFRIEDENRAVEDPNDDEYSIAAGLVRSQGIEAQVSGQMLPGWELSAGYAYNYSKYLDDPVNQGRMFSPDTPKHAASLWSKYSWSDGPLAGLSVGAGAKFQTRVFDYGGAEQDAYAIVDARVGYRPIENVEASVTVTNLFDEVYYRDVGGTTRHNYYGTPRAFLLALRATW
jgi:outer membrane receptor for ferric coprogen and ferric-rhodotorulic acid